MRGNLERAAQVQAYSAIGACFQAIMVFDEIRDLEDNKDAKDTFRHYDRIKRLCHSLVDYFDHAHDINTHEIGATHYMSHSTDPRHVTRRAIEDYQGVHAVTNAIEQKPQGARLAVLAGARFSLTVVDDGGKWMCPEPPIILPPRFRLGPALTGGAFLWSHGTNLRPSAFL